MEPKGKGLTKVLFNCLLGSQTKGVINTRDLKLRDTMHGLNVLEAPDSPKSVTGVLSRKDAVGGSWFSSVRPGDRSFCWRNSA